MTKIIHVEGEMIQCYKGEIQEFYGFTLYIIFDMFLKMAIPIMIIFVKNLKKLYKVGCVFPMVVFFILHHVEFGPNGLRKDAPHFIQYFVG